MTKGKRFRRLIIKKDEEHKIIIVEGATMVQVDFTDAKELESVYY